MELQFSQGLSDLKNQLQEGLGSDLKDTRVACVRLTVSESCSQRFLMQDLGEKEGRGMLKHSIKGVQSFCLSR